VREILFVAGEVSGDLHAARVMRELAARGAATRFHAVGIGGDEMRAAGVELVEHVEQLAVMGFIEVLEHVPKHWALLRSLERRIKSGNVALVVLIDYPTFNMKVADAAAAAGVPVLYYVTPQVWAWGADRLERLSRTVTKAAAGASEHLPIARVTNISRTVEELKENNIWTVGLDERAAQTYDSVDYNMDAALVLGGEGKGLHDLVKRKCDFLVSIPMLGKVPSLNVSVAAAVVLYEIVRQRRSKEVASNKK